jgi:hypothetical protein
MKLQIVINSGSRPEIRLSGIEYESLEEDLKSILDSLATMHKTDALVTLGAEVTTIIEHDLIDQHENIEEEIMGWLSKWSIKEIKDSKCDKKEVNIDEIVDKVMNELGFGSECSCGNTH